VVTPLSHRFLVSWAASGRRRRLAARAIRLAAPLLPDRPAAREPVFILGSPRSGTTLLFELLRRSPEVAALPGESHLLSEPFHPTARGFETTHELGAEDVAPHEPRAVRWMIDRIVLGRRYLDKAPRNSLRVPYLMALHPNARFVLMRRDGRAVVSSLITAWRSNDGRFTGMPPPGGLDIQGYGGRNWKFVIPRGWELHTRGTTLPEVCAFQWRACMEAILAAREPDPSPDRWLDVAYEDLVERPAEELGRLLAVLGLPADRAVREAAAALGRTPTKAVTPPGLDKWRRENPEEVASVLPLLEPTMRRLGYVDGDPNAGDVLPIGSTSPGKGTGAGEPGH
jgi:sulfotransferase family protein